MTIHTLRGLGWDWRQNGVLLTVQIDDQKIQVLVPLDRVFHEFSKELAAVGCPLEPAVGGYVTVSGLFGSIAHAVKGVTHAVTHNAITNAATSVAKTATNYAEHAVANTIGRVPVLGGLANTAMSLATLPANVVNQIASGGRLDQVALSSLKSALKDVKAIAPYAQTVLSMVPGVGQGLSGAIGASIALAQGQSITDALMSGVKGALPGGALAQAAFQIAADAAAGRPITTIALDALPVSPQAKQALSQGVMAARDLASGKNVSQSLLDHALHALPPDAQKAVQIGTALAHARSLQSAAGTIARVALPASAQAAAAAAGLASTYKAGMAAAQAVKLLPAHVPPPPHLLEAMHRGIAAKATMAKAISMAQQGHHEARQIVGAMTGQVGPGVHRGFKPRYHSQGASSAVVSGPIMHHHHRHAGGIHARFESHVGWPIDVRAFRELGRNGTSGPAPELSFMQRPGSVFAYR